MKECLQCQKEFKPLRESNKFCSDYCRVKWHRANPKQKTKEEKVTETKLQVLYNSLLEMVGKVNAGFPEDYRNVTKIGIMKSNGEVEPMFPTKPKIKRSYENYQQLKLDCDSIEAWTELKAEILASELPQRQKLSLTT